MHSNTPAVRLVAVPAPLALLWSDSRIDSAVFYSNLKIFLRNHVKKFKVIVVENSQRSQSVLHNGDSGWYGNPTPTAISRRPPQNLRILARKGWLKFDTVQSERSTNKNLSSIYVWLTVTWGISTKTVFKHINFHQNWSKIFFTPIERNIKNRLRIFSLLFLILLFMKQRHHRVEPNARTNKNR